MAELPKRYDPNAVEPKWYQRWMENGDFVANPDSSKPAFSIVIPPPNITGILTLGHVLNNTIQDILARRARMQGFEVLWLPGTDHAGIGTQTAVEKYLRKTRTKRATISVAKNSCGASWNGRTNTAASSSNSSSGSAVRAIGRGNATRSTTIMSAAVRKVFVDLYSKGLIYRGRRMINWDPAAQTALSDEEVISEAAEGQSCITFATRSWKNQGAFLKSRRRGRKRSWPIPAWRFIRTTSDMLDSDWQTCLASARAGENSNHRRRSDRSGVRHGRSEGDAGARQARF